MVIYKKYKLAPGLVFVEVIPLVFLLSPRVIKLPREEAMERIGRMRSTSIRMCTKLPLGCLSVLRGRRGFEGGSGNVGSTHHIDAAVSGDGNHRLECTEINTCNAVYRQYPRL